MYEVSHSILVGAHSNCSEPGLKSTMNLLKQLLISWHGSLLSHFHRWSLGKLGVCASRACLLLIFPLTFCKIVGNNNTLCSLLAFSLSAPCIPWKRAKGNGWAGELGWRAGQGSPGFGLENMHMHNDFSRSQCCRLVWEINYSITKLAVSPCGCFCCCFHSLNGPAVRS